MESKKTVSFSVDLDSIKYYYGIHGLPPRPDIATIHYSKGLSRLLCLFEQLGVKATLFAVGEDLLDEGNAAALATAAMAGHELANHSWSHRYDLTRLPASHIKVEVLKAHEIIEKTTGRPPCGFRAPGYHMSGTLLGILAGAGYLYDASLLPSPLYYLAKCSLILLSRMRGRKSHSIAGGIGMLFSPVEPFRTGRLYWVRGNGLLEIPCTVATPLRIPVIGTYLTLLSLPRLKILLRMLRDMPFLSIELHAIDLMEATCDGFEELASHQLAVAVPLREKEERLRYFASGLLDIGFQPKTLKAASFEICTSIP